MKIEILNHFSADGREYFTWELFDGPDGIEHVKGYAVDLIQCFSKIIEWREKIAEDYAREVIEDIETIKQFLNDNGQTD